MILIARAAIGLIAALLFALPSSAVGPGDLWADDAEFRTFPGPDIAHAALPLLPIPPATLRPCGDATRLSWNRPLDPVSFRELPPRAPPAR